MNDTHIYKSREDIFNLFTMLRKMVNHNSDAICKIRVTAKDYSATTLMVNDNREANHFVAIYNKNDIMSAKFSYKIYSHSNTINQFLFAHKVGLLYDPIFLIRASVQGIKIALYVLFQTPTDDMIKVSKAFKDFDEMKRTYLLYFR